MVAVKEPEHEHVADEEPTGNSEPDTQMVQRKKREQRPLRVPKMINSLKLYREASRREKKLTKKMMTKTGYLCCLW